MSKTIKGCIPVEIKISEFESRRCSRDCQFCWKENGLYQCHLRGCEDIEKLDDVDDDKFPTADTYGFLRTDFCKKTFGNGEKTKAESGAKNAQIGTSHKKTQLPPHFIQLTKMTGNPYYGASNPFVYIEDGLVFVDVSKINYLCPGEQVTTCIVFNNGEKLIVREPPQIIIAKAKEGPDK